MAEAITLDIGSNGQQLQAQGYLAVPASGSGPGVVVLHAWWGLNGFFQSLCDQFATAGFVALAPDLADGVVASTIEQAEQLSQGVDAEAGSRIIGAAIETLLHHDAVTSASVGIVGFSMGAYFALETAKAHPDDVAALVLYYGSGEPDIAPSRAAILGHFADNDPYEDAEWIASMEQQIRAAGNAITFHTYPDTGHWFAETDRPDAYNSAAAALAWQRTVDFLRDPRSWE